MGAGPSRTGNPPEKRYDMPDTTRELIGVANRVPAGGYPRVHVVVVGRAEPQPSSQVEDEVDDSDEEGQGQSL